MLRIRIQLPKKTDIHYKYLDILHDAMVSALVAAGAKSEQITGMSALPWHFAALGYANKQEKTVYTLIVSTPDATLAKILPNINPAEIRYARASTLEVVNFAEAEISLEDDPIMHGQNMLGVLMLSPLAISDKSASKGKRWYKQLGDCDLSAAINHRLSRLAGREIKLQVQPDSLYIRINPDHSVLVPMKLMRNGKTVFVIGMNAPLVVTGSEEDLRFAWYTGIGEKTRNGFGCIGLAEQGVGR